MTTRRKKYEDLDVTYLPRKLLITVTLVLPLMLSGFAFADGNVTCDSGPKQNWVSIKKLKKTVWMEGWKLIKTEITNDCYEVYARTESGQVIEAFFHPVTLEKLIVYRRGREIYRAEGFDGVKR